MGTNELKFKILTMLRDEKQKYIDYRELSRKETGSLYFISTCIEHLEGDLGILKQNDEFNFVDFNFKLVPKLTSLGMWKTEAVLFLTLIQIGKLIKIAELGNITKISRTAVYTALKKMEKSGLVVITPFLPKKVRALDIQTALDNFHQSLTNVLIQKEDEIKKELNLEFLKKNEVMV